MSRFGDLLGAKKEALKTVSAPAPEPVVELAAEPVVELAAEPVVEPVVEEVVTEKSHEDINFDVMGKKQLEAYGRQHGIELDRRHSRSRLVVELKNHLSNS